MRLGFGIVSLLLTIAIILWLMVGGVGGPGYLQTVSDTNKQLRSQVNVMSGFDPTRQILATSSIHYRIDRTAGRPKLIVTEVMKNGPMEMTYGFQPNDRVTEIGGLDFDMNIGTHSAATDEFHRAYSAGLPIVVVRDGKPLSLPTPEHVAAIAKMEREARIADAASKIVPTPSAQDAPPVQQEQNAMQKAMELLGGK